jgi:hypothetical protein
MYSSNFVAGSGAPGCGKTLDDFLNFIQLNSPLLARRRPQPGRHALWAVGLLTMWSLVTAPFCLAAEDEPVYRCEPTTSEFDGRSPLEYGSISVPPGSRAYLHIQFPAECRAGNTGCATATYLVSEDKVAVGKQCGPWTFVQFIGDQRVSYGWVSTDEIHVERTGPARESRMASGAVSEKPVFKLTRGKAIPVCEAYLQRLNTTEFTSPAYCGRPENDQVPGFADLNREPAMLEGLDGLSDLVMTILSPLTLIGPDQYEAMNQNGGVFTGTPYHLSSVYGPFASWTYDPPVDLSNSGHPDKVLIWNPDNPLHPECGQYQGRIPTAGGAAQIAFVLTADGKTLDQAKTIRIFGHPDGGFVVPSAMRSAAHPTAFLRSYRPIGESYGIFKYRTLYYFDTFFDGDGRLGDFEDKRRGNQALSRTLGVFLHRDGKTRQICEYDTRESKQSVK